MSARADELCELTDAVLCADGPVKTLAGMSLAPGHRRGLGALYDAVNCGRIDIARLRRVLAGRQVGASKWRCPTGECQPASAWVKANRLHTLIPRSTDRWKGLYHQRGAVEREFGALKH